MNYLLVVNGDPLVHLGDDKELVTSILQKIMLKAATNKESKATRYVEDAVMVKKDTGMSIFSIAKTTD